MSREAEDWKRIQRLGLLGGVTSLEIYASRCSAGLALGRFRFAKSVNVFPTPDEIKTLHRHAFEFVHPWAGEFRKGRQEVEFGQIVGELPIRIQRGLSELKRDMDHVFNSFRDKEHQLLTLSFYHAAFEAIHPFRDGNGRVGRAILGAQVERVFGRNVGLVIERHAYMKGLEAAQLRQEVAPLADLVRGGIVLRRDISRTRDQGRGVELNF